MKYLLYFLPLFLHQLLFADEWIPKTDFMGTARYGVAYFSIGDKGYIALGAESAPSDNFVNDLWEYDPSADSWTQKAAFPGAARYNPIRFTIGNRAYVGCGFNGSYFSDMWQYDQASNTWNQKNNFAGTARSAAVSFVVNDKGYAGLGQNGATFFDDFYSYNETTDTWTAVADFPGTPRALPFSFGIEGYGYVGAGATSVPVASYGKDLWRFDPVANTWVQKADFPGLARYAVVYFTIGSKGYAGLGKNSTTSFTDFFMYNPATDTWTQKANCPVNGIEGGFETGGNGFAGCGINLSGTITKEFWEYAPDFTDGILLIAGSKDALQVVPNPFTYTATFSIENNLKNAALIITDLTGHEIARYDGINGKSFSISRGNMNPGIYCYQLIENQNTVAAGKFVVTLQ